MKAGIDTDDRQGQGSDAEERIIGVCEEMAAACDDPVANTASIENFPMTDNRRECAKCFFQAVCYDKPDWPIHQVNT